MFGEISEKPLSSTVFLTGDVWYPLPYKYQDVFYTNMEMACLYKPKGYLISFGKEPPLEFDLKLDLILQGVDLGLAEKALPFFYQRFEDLVPGVVWFRSSSMSFAISEMYYDLVYRSISFKDKQFSMIDIGIPYLIVSTPEFKTTTPGNLLAIISSCEVDEEAPMMDGSVFIENI